MPIYIYKGNSQISTNAIRNDKAVKAIYAKEQGKDAVCVWGVGINTWFLTYTKNATEVAITGLKTGAPLDALTIPETIENLPVTHIASTAFKNNTKLKLVELPNSLQVIEYQSFYGCTGLSNISIPDSVTSVGQYAFYNTAWYNNQLDGLVYAGRVAYDYKGMMPSNTSVVIKNGTFSITEYIFYDYTSLVSVTIPDSVTNIGKYAFRGCTGLTSITIPDSVTSIGDGAFYKCSGLTIANWNATACTSAGTTQGFIFEGCSNLATANIGDNVKIIPSLAFCGCTGLTRITFNGTKAQWNAIYKGTNWNSNTGNYTIHCTDGDIPKS